MSNMTKNILRRLITPFNNLLINWSIVIYIRYMFYIATTTRFSYVRKYCNNLSYCLI